MGQFLIFSIFLYFASVNFFSNGYPTDWEDETNLISIKLGKQLAMFKECAQLYNTDEKNYRNKNIFEVLAKNEDEAMCMLACSIRKNFAKEVTVSDPLKTWYNATTKLIEQASRNGFEQAARRRMTIQDVTNSVENCYANAKNECDFFGASKCSEARYGQCFITWHHIPSKILYFPLKCFA